MVVKIQKIMFFLLPAILIGQENISETKCDQTLLKTFKLQGLPYASLKDKMHICGHVENNCCTLIDELSITKYWYEFSQPRLKQFVSAMMILYKNVFNYQKYITMIEFRHVQFHITKTKWVSYKKKYCSMLENVEEFKQYDPDKVLNSLRTQVYEEQQYHKELDVLVTDSFENMSDPRFLFLPKSIKNMFSRMTPKPMPSPKLQIILQNISKDPTEEARLAALVEMRKKMEEERIAYEARKKAALLAMSKELAVKMVSSATEAREIYSKKFLKFLKDSRQDLPKLRANHKETVNKMLRDGKIFIEDMPNQILGQAREFHVFMEKLKNMARQGIRIEAEALKTVRMPDINRNYIKALMELVNKTDFLGHSLPDLPDMRRDMPEYPEISSSKVVCTAKTRKLHKYFMLVNAVKYRFCSKAFNNILSFNDLHMEVYLIKLRDEAMTLFNMKRSLYCGVCEASTQKFFNYEKKIVYYSEDFCRNLINAHMDYIKFNNVIFVEYADEILQYLSCVNSAPSDMVVPFKNIFHRLKKRIVFFNRCFNNVNRMYFMKHCHFICSKYNINGLHAFIEGDMHNAYLLYLRIVEFIRQHKLPFSSKLEISLETIEKLNHFFYTNEPIEASMVPKESRMLGPAHGAEDEKKKKKKKAKKAKKPKKPKKKKKQEKKQKKVKVEEREDAEDNKVRFNMPIYKRIDKTVLIRKLEPVFLKEDDGFNPLETYYATDFLIENKEYILKHFYKDGSDVLSEDVISTFFTIKPKDVSDFNGDMYVNLEDYEVINKKLPHQIDNYKVKNLPGNLSPQYGQSHYIPSTITPRADEEFKIINYGI